MNETLKLYRVTLRGMTYGNNAYGVSYVVAHDTALAYRIVREYLDKNDLGFSVDRELKTVELIAECSRYPGCQHILYMPDPEASNEAG